MSFKTVNIQRFKNLNNLSIELEKINVIVGSNNSGKSSILQAIQFAVSVAQTTKLEKTAYWHHTQDRLPTSISQTQLIYSPLQDVPSLAPFGNLVESQDQGIIVNFIEAESENTSKICISRGKNKNIRIEITGELLGTQLQSIENPYCIYVPGLAGIQGNEEFRPPSYVRRAAARGDANNVFRNILLLLKRDTEAWPQFLSDFQTIFPNLSVVVEYDYENDDSINTFIKIGYKKLPIDAAGTGVLQAIQILSYVNLYGPKVLLLDEPDAHLHPNNQRVLARLLVHLVETRSLQIIICTHSRHILDELSGHAKIHWVREGQLVQEDNPDVVNVLMEIGALDVGDRLRQGSTKCVILTEDEIVLPISILLESSGFQMDQTEIWPYKGCSKKEIALTLAAFIRKHAPATKLVIHRDRDYYTDDELLKYRQEIEGNNIYCFITAGSDVESYYISSEHITFLYPSITSLRCNELIIQATTESRDQSIIKYTNSRVDIERRKAYKNGTTINVGEISLDVTRKYDENPSKYRHGKSTLGILTAKIQQELQENPKLIRISPNIKDAQLTRITDEIWPSSQ